MKNHLPYPARPCCVFHFRNLSQATLLVLALWHFPQGFGTSISGTISSQTWSSSGNPYVLTGTVTLPVSNILTIQSGVVVQFGTGAQLVVKGTISASGTSGSPITFTSSGSPKTKGSYGGLVIQSPDGSALNSGSVLNYVVIEYAGNGGAAVLVDKATVTISNSTVRSSSRSGVNAVNGGYVQISSTAFNDNGSSSGDYPVLLENYTAHSTLSGLSMSGNFIGGGIDTNAVGIQQGMYDQIRTSVQWSIPGAGIPYQLVSQITVEAGGTLVIDPGVTVKRTLYALIVKNGGKLLAIGTSDKRITFTVAANPPAVTASVALQFDGDASAMPTDSSVQYADILYGYHGIQADNASPFLSHITLSNCGRHGFHSPHKSGAGIYDSASLNNGEWAFNFHDFSGNPTLAGLTASGNGTAISSPAYNYNAVSSDSGILTADATWKFCGLPYIHVGGIIVNAGVTLTVEPGVELQFGTPRILTIRGRLLALGTAARPILFTSSQITKTAGWWDGIHFEGFENAPSLGSVLDYVTVEYGGAQYANLTTSWGGVAVTNSKIRNSARHGIYVGLGGEMFTIRSSQITGVSNTYFGLNNLHWDHPNFTIVSAPNNWWGAASGPTLSCNAAGTGVRVSEGVDFAPVWGDPNGTAPGLLEPGKMLTLTLEPDRYFVPADNAQQAAIAATLRDGAGKPVSGYKVTGTTSRGTVVYPGGITDVTGKTYITMKSGSEGEATITGSVQTSKTCELIRKAYTSITFTPSPAAGTPTLDTESTYATANIDFNPKPAMYGVPLTVSITLRNTSGSAQLIGGTLYILQSGIGLASGPYIKVWSGETLPANGSLTLQAPYTPTVEGHFCFKFDYSWSSALGSGAGHSVSAPLGSSTAGKNTNANPSPMTPLARQKQEDEGLERTKKQMNVRKYGEQTSNTNKEEQNKNTMRDILRRSDTMRQIDDNMRTDGLNRKRRQLARLPGEAYSARTVTPRQDYTTLAVPVRPPLTVYQAGADNLDTSQVAALNTLLDALTDGIAVGRAVILSNQRYAGAAEAGSSTWMAQQTAAYLHYKKQLGGIFLRMSAAFSGWLSAYPGDIVPTLNDVVLLQARLTSPGFTTEERNAYLELGNSDDDIEAIRLAMTEADPAEKLFTLREEWAGEAADYLALGNLMAYPDASFSQQISGTRARGQAAVTDNLASGNPIEETILIGNPTGAAATVTLLPRKISLPEDWSVTVNPRTLTSLAPSGTDNANAVPVTVIISPAGPVPQGFTGKAAVEAFIDSVRIGGVEFKVQIPYYVPFGFRINLPLLLR